jgi:FtsZ-binding cell division protein ZapB
MSLPTILKKIESLQMAIECIEVLVLEFDDNYLLPTFNYLKEKKQLTANELSTFTHNIDVQSEEINRLSHI